jgi:hypothetical protein
MLALRTVLPCSVKAIVIWLLFAAAAARADTVTLTLDPNYPSAYIFYSYTATDGTSQTLPINPYLATMNDPSIGTESILAICFDINNPTYAGTAYTGHYAYPTDLASMEATYLVDLMSASGGYTAPLAEQGAISLAIWQIMFPTSTKTDGTYFPADPAALAYETQANLAVTSGGWTIADSAQYPIFMPDDTTAQRFGIVLPGVSPIDAPGPPAPEPPYLPLLGVALLGVAFTRRHSTSC